MKRHIDNPFVGPRPYSPKEWNLFYGRERETDELLTLILADRLVVFSAPSGAGKTSLINTSLRRNLKRYGFKVLPSVRVSGDLPAGIDNVSNIFMFNVLYKLDKGRHTLDKLSQMTLDEYVCQQQATLLSKKQAWRYLLVVDQFEEIFTLYPQWSQKRANFFVQLRTAQEKDPDLWVLLAMREEHVAALEPYRPLVPNRLGARYYLQRLHWKAALDAIQESACQAGRQFADDAATALVDNLRLVSVRDHQGASLPGDYVEPVQLQVVCRQLWEEVVRNDPQGQAITLQDLQGLARGLDLQPFVSSSLGRFYEDAIADAIAKTGGSELKLRRWFDTELISEGIRLPVLRGKEETRSLPNNTVKVLTDRLLIRPMERSDGVFYELIHDSMIEPILTSNRTWYQGQPVIRLAEEWKTSDYDDSKLLEGSQLLQAEQSGVAAFDELVDRYLRRSREAENTKLRQKKEEQQQLELAHAHMLTKVENLRAEEAREYGRMEERLVRRLKIAFAVAIVATVIALVFAFLFGYLRYQTHQRFTALLADEARDEIATDPQLGLLLAAEAAAISPESAGQPMTYTLSALKFVMERTGGVALSGKNGYELTGLSTLAVTRDGTHFAAGDQSGMIHVWEFRDTGITATVSLQLHQAPVMAIMWSPDGQWLASAASDGVHLFNPEDSMLFSQTLTNRESTAVAFSPEGDQLAVGGVGEVQLYDLRSQAQPGVLPADNLGRVKTIGFSPNGAWLVALADTHRMDLWHTSTATLLPNVPPSNTNVDAVAFSPDSQLIAFGGHSAGDPLFIAELPLADEIDIETIHKELVNYPLTFQNSIISAPVVAFFPESITSHNAVVAFGSSDGSVYMWYCSQSSKELDRINCKGPDILPGHMARVTDLAFDHQAVRMVSVDESGEVRFWNLESLPPQQLGSAYAGHHGGGVKAAFLSDYSHFITLGRDGVARGWNWTQLPDLGGATWREQVCNARHRAAREFEVWEKKFYFQDEAYAPLYRELCSPDLKSDNTYLSGTYEEY